MTVLHCVTRLRRDGGGERAPKSVVDNMNEDLVQSAPAYASFGVTKGRSEAREIERERNVGNGGGQGANGESGSGLSTLVDIIIIAQFLFLDLLRALPPRRADV